MVTIYRPEFISGRFMHHLYSSQWRIMWQLMPCEALLYSIQVLPLLYAIVAVLLYSIVLAVTWLENKSRNQHGKAHSTKLLETSYVCTWCLFETWHLVLLWFTLPLPLFFFYKWDQAFIGDYAHKTIQYIYTYTNKVICLHVLH